MAKLTIYYGGKSPMIAIGTNQCHLLAFAEKYPGWHSFKQDRATKTAVNALCRKGYIEAVNDQFRITYPKG